MNPILNPKQPKAVVVVDDGDVAIKLRYVGAQASATVTVSSDGDLTFKHGVAGAEVVDSTVGASGVMDVSTSSYNTFAKVLDNLNGSANWEAYLVDALRADSSIDTLATLSEATISPNTELSLSKDTSVALELAIRIGKRSNVTGSEAKSAAEIYSITSVNTFASGTSLIKIYEVNEDAKTETLIYSLAGGATTVEDTKTFVSNGRGSLGVSKVGNYLVVKMVGSAACTGSLQAVGAVGLGS